MKKMYMIQADDWAVVYDEDGNNLFEHHDGENFIVNFLIDEGLLVRKWDNEIPEDIKDNLYESGFFPDDTFERVFKDA